MDLASSTGAWEEPCYMKWRQPVWESAALALPPSEPTLFAREPLSLFIQLPPLSLSIYIYIYIYISRSGHSTPLVLLEKLLEV